MSKKVTCDICQKAMDSGSQLYKWDHQADLVFEVHKDAHFKFHVEVDSFQFLTTGIDMCKPCVLKAIVSRLQCEVPK